MGKDLSGKELGVGLSQRKDGTYCARFTNRFGKRRSIYAADLRSLKKKFRGELQKDISQRNVNASFTFDEWYEKWMDIYKYQIRENSRRHYRQLYQKHITPSLGKKALEKITSLDILSLLKQMDLQGYHYQTKASVRMILLGLFNKAMLDDFVLKKPVRAIRIPWGDYAPRRVLSQEEQSEFFDACKGSFYEELFTVAVLTGLRPGELCALRWQDIDLAQRTIHVSRTLIYQKFPGDTQKTFYINPPKTKSSLRSVYFDSRCEAALKNQLQKKLFVSAKASAKTLPGFDDLLFVTKFDTPITSQIYANGIRSVLASINDARGDSDPFPPFSAHCFRHTYATRCFEAGVVPKVVQKQLGHSSLAMTMDLYTHLLEDKKQDELQKFSTMSNTVFDSSGQWNEAGRKRNAKIVRF